MIYSVNGKLMLIEPNFVVVETNGIGYGIKTTMNTISQLPREDKEVFLYTYLNVREDAMELFGFATKGELECFKLLININGVGPKAALTILSDNTPEQLSLIIASSDAKALTRSVGIGIKTAQRIVLELKDKVTNQQIKDSVGAGASSPIPNSKSAEAISALVALGYSQSEASGFIATLSGDLSVEEMIKSALKGLSSK